MIAANVGTRERSCVCLVGAERYAMGFQDEVYLVVNKHARLLSKTTCVCGECRQGWVGGSLQTPEVSTLCCLSLQCQIFLLSLSSVGTVSYTHLRAHET